MLVKTKFRFFSLVVFSAVIIFTALTTCETPMGMGDPIDWEAPVLTVDKVPNPYYVRKGSVLTGTVVDNIGVDKMIFIDAATGKELLPVIRQGKNWVINLAFTDAQNGEKIVGQIIAYDRAGNSGETSIAFITMIIDIKPPVLSTLEIRRTDSKNQVLMYTNEETKQTVVPDSYKDLKALEGSDRRDDLYKYQNGWFYITGIIDENETRTKSVSLEFYDYDKIDTPLLQLPFIETDGSLDYPKWLIKEEDLLDAGVTVFGADYKTNYYNNSATRYYYRVVIKAFDMSGNENIQDEQIYICLWADSDKPKGIADPLIVGTGDKTTLPKGTPIPVDFYDDDELLWAYTGLIKKAQWGVNGMAGAAEGSRTAIPAGTDEQKLLWLKQTLTGATGDNVTLGTQGTVNDWNQQKIVDQVGGKSMDQKLFYVTTGTQPSDYGDYVLFTIVADKKLTPHDNSGPQITNKGRWTGRIVEINLKDENAPLIVFDTTATPPCPEENTFPEVLVDKEDFYLVGYTLRENGNGSNLMNYVKNFRLAWIPYNIPGGQDSKVVAVQNALKDLNYGKTGALFDDPSLAGVQHWDFSVETTTSVGTPAPGKLKLDSYQYDIPGNASKYTKQSFSKKFNVMGKADDVKTSTFNFTYNKLENETKLFIFYAIDNTGNEVFRQLPILGFKASPKMVILDITYNLDSMPLGIPNPTETDHFDPSTGAPTQTYYDKLNTYNKDTSVKTALQDASVSEISPGSIKESEGFAIYPRGTTLKYWVKATENDGNTIPISTLTMQDITFAGKPADRVTIGSGFNTTDKTFSFCEYYPDVTQRTFLFTATDQLGNTASLQRTVAISNAARLESITTQEQSGTYGHGKTIVLQANFSSQIYVGNDDGLTGTALTDQLKKPAINYRYMLDGQSAYTYGSATCNTPAGGNNTNGFGLFSTPTISLTFNFEVPENAVGDLETIYEGIAGTGTYAKYDRPITIADGTKIYDNTRKDSAFIPGYAAGNITMPNWKDTTNTLQPKKKITLDGVHPKITGTGKKLVDIKAPYTGTDYYFKTGESISIQLTADKDIRALGNSRLSYTIVPKTGTGITYNTYFKYQKPVSGDSKSLIYSLKIDADSCPIDGELTNVSLYRAADSDIVDNSDNNVVLSTATNLLSGLGRFYIKRSIPGKPKATLNNSEAGITDTNGGLESVTRTDFRGIVRLRIPNSDSTTWPEWEDRKQYSLDGGINWLPNSLSGTTTLQEYPIDKAGTYPIQVRYLDRAGNEGTVAKKTITIGETFPALISVNAKEPNGWYIATTKSLTFNLNFADTVTVRTPANVRITLKNRNSAATGEDAGKDTITLNTNKATGYSGTTITFEWTDTYPAGGFANKEMRDGLYISDVVLSGLEDKFGLTGPTGTGGYTGTPTGTFSFPDDYSKDCFNLMPGLKVDAIAPAVTDRTPKHNIDPTGNDLVKTITLKFREPVMKGSGVITIRPRGNYAIPPVLDDTGYYLGYATTAGVESETGPVPTKYTTAGTNRTYISSFYDIYNAVGTTDRTALTQSTSNTMSTLKLNDRTGQSYGPYKKMTQGLVSGYGYTGDYDNSPGPNVADGVNAPDANRFTAMIPDTATKWVLDYRYPIIEPTGSTTEINEQRTAIVAIRTALTNAKWRWQEIDVVNVNIANNTTTVPNTGTVTITLNEPLLKGLDWDVFYPEGTFTDLAGNPAPASGVIKATRATSGADSTNNVYTLADVAPGATGAYVPIYVNGVQYTAFVVSNPAKTFRIYPAYTTTGGANTGGTTSNLGNEISLWIGLDYYFTSPGVQAPVIRVNRRSFDARNSGWSSTSRTYNAPGNTTTGGTTGWDTNGAVISDKGLGTDTGWGIQDFNYVHYRVESESSAVKPNTAAAPSVTAKYYKGTASNKGAITAAWSGNVQTSSLNDGPSLLIADPGWRGTTATRGTWVLPNLIRRAAETTTSSTDRTYTVVTKTGVPEARTAQVSVPLRMLKSYNKDLTISELNGTTTITTTPSTLNNGQGVISFKSLEANKSYVIGSATLNDQTVQGYEGVFRTVIVLPYASNRGSNFIQVQGSNIKNGMPSVAGFPVRDAEENGDNRFIKVFYSADLQSFYWVSTEIVCEWYFLMWGGGSGNLGTHQTVGEVNNYLMVGYGDLTYGFGIVGSNGSQ